MTLKPSTSGSCAKKIWLQVSAPGVSLPAPNAAPVHVFCLFLLSNICFISELGPLRVWLCYLMSSDVG